MGQIHRYWLKRDVGDVGEVTPPTDLRPAAVYSVNSNWICVDVEGGTALNLSFLQNICKGHATRSGFACLHQTTADVFQGYAVERSVAREVSREELEAEFSFDPWHAPEEARVVYLDTWSAWARGVVAASFLVTFLGKFARIDELLLLAFGLACCAFYVLLRRSTVVVRVGGALIGSFVVSVVAAWVAALFAS